MEELRARNKDDWGVAGHWATDGASSGDSAWAQGSDSQTLELTSSRDSGVSGTATLTEVGGQLQVQLNVQGLPEDGVEHIAHIHTDATCADDRADQGGPVEFPLEDVVAQGNAGSSSTTLDTTLSDLSDGTERYVNVHAEILRRR